VFITLGIIPETSEHLSSADEGAFGGTSRRKASQAIALLIKDRATMKAVIIKDNKTTYDGVRFIFVKMFS
jgi:hypothetical protein